MLPITDHPAPSQKLAPALYVVATPLGNLADITHRALAVLQAADAIACEDTRHSAKLLEHFGIRKPLVACHEHNEASAAAAIVERIRAGEAIALVSDAGTPAISDPGARLVRAVQDAGLTVVPLPGASAVVTALSASGLMFSRFLFAGFLPAKPGARRSAIEALGEIDCALVLFEAPHRIHDTVADLARVLSPEREIVIARELTKLFEQIVRVPLAEAPGWLSADPNHARGEFVLVVAPPAPREGVSAAARRTLHLLLDQLPLKSAVKLAAEISGENRNALYALALAARGETGDADVDPL